LPFGLLARDMTIIRHFRCVYNNHVVSVWTNRAEKRQKTAIFSGHIWHGFRYGAVMPLWPNGRQIAP
jgi:hypothetical protein